MVRDMSWDSQFARIVQSDLFHRTLREFSREGFGHYTVDEMLEAMDTLKAEGKWQRLP